ncbi:MAG: hypothetical protein ACD_40C00059G0003 [uncultured bacterium]|nr:MAG: hypothetical protein ACD_40C00059G0003 [uncultured bacterium]
MKKALILHSWFSHPEDNWYPWLKSELEKKGYEVWAPELPTMPTKAPDMETMLKFVIGKNFVDESTVVIGHSLGAVLALRLAGRIAFNKGILLAAWDYNDLTPEHASFWHDMMNHSQIKENVKEWVFPISDNDPYVTSAIAKEVAGRVNGRVVEVGKKGHFLTKEDGVTEVSEILEFV